MKTSPLYIILLFFRSVEVYEGDLCSIQEYGCLERMGQYPCGIKSMISSRDCTQISFSEVEKMKDNLGNVALIMYPNKMLLNITFSSVKWRRAYLRISDDNNRNHNFCKMYTVEREVNLPEKSNLYDTCFWTTARKLNANTYFLEYKAENKEEALYQKIVFNMPKERWFAEAVNITEKEVFSYVDFSNSYEIVLYIQALPRSYNVSHYKVEVFREKDKAVIRLEERLLFDPGEDSIRFPYMTYNEEGCYFFAISLISERCSKQNICSKTLTARVYINKKGTPLVIGIVGASFLIPFVLFLFHMWNRRLKNSGGVPDAVEKILILFKPSSDKHNEVVATLAKTIKHLTAIEVMLDPISLSKTKQKHAEKWCSDNLILATHILYVAPPDIDDNACALDCMTYSFLKGETKKSIPEKNIIILHLPYSTKELPSVLQKCVKFELMVDFQKLLKVFQPLAPEFNYENNINCMELTARIKQTQAEMENFHRLDEFDEPEISVLL